MVTFGLTVGALVCGVVFADRIKGLVKTYVTDKVVAFLSKYLPSSWL
jgi:hypothetical protein